MSSVEQIVRQIIEDLSEGVSELVLLVVVLAEQNQAMPSSLPAAAHAVNETAAKLAKIAKNLAAQDYKEYPPIAQEINEAAVTVEGATQTLETAVQNKAGDLKKRWDLLVDACRVMSGKTIRLLQIVYGAPLKRLQLNADRLMDEIDKFDPRPKGLANQGNQQKVIDAIKPITDKALKQEKYLNDRAKGEERPKAKQELGDAAKDIRDKAQKLIDKVNKGFDDPDNADFSEPLRDLRDAVQKGRDISDKNAPPAPRPPPGLGVLSSPRAAPPAPGGFPEAIERAKQSARDLPQQIKKDPKYFPNASQQVKDDVGALRDKIRPNPHAPYDWDKEMEVPLADQYRAARDALKSPGDPRAQKALDDATDNLVRALDDLGKKQREPRDSGMPPRENFDPRAGDKGPVGKLGNYQGTPSFDPRAGDKGPTGGLGQYPMPPRAPHGPAGDTAKQLHKPIAQVAAPLAKAFAKPEDQEALAREGLKDNMRKLNDALDRQDPKAVAENLKQAVNNAKNLGNQMRQNADNPHIPEPARQNKRQAADDIDRALPHFVEKGKEAVKDLHNDPAVRAFQEAMAPLQRAADRGAPPYNKRSPGGYDQVKDPLQKAIDAVKRGDKNAAQKALQDAAAPFNQGRNFNVNKGGHHIPDPSEGDKISDELQKLFDKFRNAGNRGDPNEMNKILPEIENAWKNWDKATGASPQFAADRLGDAADDVQAAIDSGDPHRFQPAAQGLADKFKDFANDVAKHPEPRVQQAGKKAVDELKPQIEDYLKKARDALQNPNDRQKAGAAAAAHDRLKKPLAEFKKNASPQQDDVLSNENHAAGVKKALADLQDALRTGDPNKIAPALNNLQKALRDYNDNARKLTPKEPDHGKRDYLNDKLDDLDDMAKELDNFNPKSNPDKLARAVNKIPNIIDDFGDTLNNSPADDTIKAAAKANNLKATLDDIPADDMDLGDLLTAAKELSQLMGGMIGSTTKVAQAIGNSGQELSQAAKSALELDGLLKSLEGGNIGVSAKAGQVRGGATLFEKAPAVPLSKAKSFEDVAAAVAYNIYQESKAISETGGSLATELGNLAVAARSGDKQKMLVAAKAASAHVTAFSKEIRAIALKIPGKNAHERSIQDNLLRCADGLGNYGVHLKILTSVKAASIESSKDTDESLSSLTSELGDIIGSALNLMHITQSTIFHK